ncbi:MAG: glycosyl transferase [Bacteroidota bacterium]
MRKNKTAAFTLCSNNYLAFAISLGHSFIENNPGYDFIIGIVDKPSEFVDYSSLRSKFKILFVDEINIPQGDRMSQSYSIVEFNTSVKPFYFNHLFQELNYEKVFYLDPDILVFSSFHELEEKLEKYDILFTPHAFTPFPDMEMNPNDASFLRHGLYNLGFLGLNGKTTKFLEWWSNKMETYCIHSYKDGFFVDQKWMDLAPLYFENVHILNSKGLNVAVWNLHEREVNLLEGEYLINKSIPLIFYHFSGYKPNNPDEIKAVTPSLRHSFHDKSDLKILFDSYRKILMENGNEFYSNIMYAYKADKEARVDLDNKQAPRSMLRKFYSRLGF